jgi:hypothetical protein
MTDIKRSPGRPKGSGKNDSQILANVADVLVTNPKLTATAAMKQIIRSRSDWGATPETLLRRLQDKWKKDKATLMEAASERASRVNLSPKSVGSFASISSMSRIEALQKWADAPVVRAAQGLAPPAHQKFLDFVNSPKNLGQMLALEKYARGLVDDPFQKRLLELQKAADTFSGIGLNKLRGSFF